MKQVLTLILLPLLISIGAAADPKPLKLLFLGDNGHHRPAERYRQLAPALAARKIEVVYTDKPDALSDKTLAGYDGLIIYANIDAITPEQEKALLAFVASGKGFIPLHCASYCFRNSNAYVELVGAQFARHGTGTFRVGPAVKDHPITKGFGGFESWDETYVHTKHNEKDRTVLEYREGRDGKEPWTWVRTHGKGRVFYTAWGHDERTFGHPGFVNLVERGIRWACGGDPSVVPAYSDGSAGPVMVGPRKDVKPFEYTEGKLPFYPAGQKWGTQAEPITKMQKPLPPEESVKHYQHPAGFELKLFASEPNFGGKPIAMNWDERGRLWVCVTVDYPNNMQPAGQGHDKIVVCEDTDGDGVADKFSVFADRLSIPTSLAFGLGGVIVQQAPNTLFLKDTDGDGTADVRQVLFTGWGTRDTHAGPSNLRYGPDGWYYGMVGYSGFDGTVAGERHRFGQGFYRFKVEADGDKAAKVTRLEFLRGTNNNSWGVGFSEDGLLFGSTANGCPSVFLAIPNRYYERVRGWSSSVLPSIAASNQFHPITEKVRQVDWHGGFTAAAGHALYTARAYPKEYWNKTAFVSDPTGHLTATFVLEPNGSDFRARYGWNLVAGVDEWHAPIMADVGPDGNVWVLDWYNIIVQHNPTPQGFRTGRGGAYESELRDKKLGRVYRLVPTGQKADHTSLAGATDEQLVTALKNPTMLWRQHAQRLLVERRAVGVGAALAKLVTDPAVDDAGLNVGAIHALWTLGGLGLTAERTGPGAEAISIGLEHKSAAVRRAAVQVMPPTQLTGTKVIKCFELLEDPDPQVRLAALLTVSEIPPSETAGDHVATALLNQSNLDDRWLPDALTAAAAAHDLFFLKAAASKKLPAKAHAIVANTAEHLARRAPEKGLDGIAAALASADPKFAETVVAALAKGWPKGKTTALSPESEKALADLLPKLPAGSKGQLLRLAAAWGSREFEKYTGEVATTLTAEVADEKLSDDRRVAAARQLTEFRPVDAKVVEAVLDAITLRSSPALATGLVEAAGLSTTPELGPAILSRYAGWSPAPRTAALRVLLARPDTTRVYLDAVEKGTVQLSELALDQKQALAAHPEARLAARAKGLLAKGGGLPNADRQKVIDELMPITKKTGDATNGKAMFTKHCAACHQHSGEGNKIGPDLTGMAVHPKEELIVHVLDPSRSVEGNFRLYQVRMLDGKVLNGMLASETRTSVELIDSQAKKAVLLREDIESLTASTKSLMPDGFEKQMNPQELTDLLEFLTKRGKYLPIPLDKAATIVSTKGMFISEEAPEQRLVFADWKPKTVGEVPFVLVDPAGDKVPNVILLYSASGKVAARMPKSATVTVNSAAKTIHVLGGVSGWGFPYGTKGSVSMKVRLVYDDGQTEEHALKNGEQLADYIRRVDVPGSKFAFDLNGRQVRYLTVTPARANVIKQIEFVKGDDASAPVVVAVTIEGK
jgi:uncharacterized protein